MDLSPEFYLEINLLLDSIYFQSHVTMIKKRNNQQQQKTKTKHNVSYTNYHDETINYLIKIKSHIAKDIIGIFEKEGKT